ncbi:family 16 glycoside hydrolase [Flagellimonas sp. W118]|uniref:family 16 glycoside hydrolase n=1 Tax=Flagellimonas sp. W118 TaxID=3410791 RepID=UPI003BF4AB87
MKKKVRLMLSMVLAGTLYNCAQTNPNRELITPEQLSKWQTFDKGKSTVNGNELIVEETKGSDGYFLISPNILKKDFILKYMVKALSESTVLINLFSVTQNQGDQTFELPPNTSTPQEVWQWRTEMKHYNLTFNNRSHGIKPFFFKNNSPYSRGFHENLPGNIMETGEWNSIEIGKKENRLWFKLNDKIYFNVEDCEPLGEGRLIFRISGTTGENVILAKAAFKDIVISYE